MVLISSTIQLGLLILPSPPLNAHFLSVLGPSLSITIICFRRRNERDKCSKYSGILKTESAHASAQHDGQSFDQLYKLKEKYKILAISPLLFFPC